MIYVPKYHLCDGYKMPSKKEYINTFGKTDGKLCYALDKWQFSVDKKEKRN